MVAWYLDVTSRWIMSFHLGSARYTRKVCARSCDCAPGLLAAVALTQPLHMIDVIATRGRDAAWTSG
jgi:hypothetical protein